MNIIKEIIKIRVLQYKNNILDLKLLIQQYKSKIMELEKEYNTLDKIDEDDGDKAFDQYQDNELARKI